MARTALLLLSPLLAVVFAEPAGKSARHAMVTAGMRFDQLLSRQASDCGGQANYYPCPDGVGCCPNGDTCILLTDGEGDVEPACGVPCPDPSSLCASLGNCCTPDQTCGVDGVCSPSGGGHGSSTTYGFIPYTTTPSSGGEQTPSPSNSVDFPYTSSTYSPYTPPPSASTPSAQSSASDSASAAASASSSQAGGAGSAVTVPGGAADRLDGSGGLLLSLLFVFMGFF